MSIAALKGNANGTGTVTIETPNTNSDFTISLPAATGTAMVSGNMPAFYAYANNTQTVNNTTSKVQLNTEIFDTASCFDSTTNYRFTPNVAGYYQINVNLTFGSGIGTNIYVGVWIYKNGSQYTYSTNQPNNGNYSGASAANIVYLNGSTDYVEMYAVTNGNFSTVTGSQWTNMSGVLVRAA